MSEAVVESTTPEVVNQAVEAKTENAAPATAAKTPEAGRTGPVYRPAVDVYETAEEVVIVAATPGASADGIDVHFEDGVLTLHASVPSRHGDARYLVREYGVGDYHRTFRVGERIDATGITAQYRDGLVRLRLPKAEAAKPRKISVRAAE